MSETSARTAAELLREAAKKLGEVAASPERGPWTAEITERGHAWINLPAYEHAWGMHGFPDEARYVALMHPGVATQLAYLLNAMADELADGEAIAVEDEAFAVARALLGGIR